MSDKLLEVESLKKIYHDEDGETLALDNISFSIYKNEFISIIGPSGCGKSTILSILAEVDNKSDGNIKYKDNNLKFGYMLQKDSLFEWLTVLDNCLLGLKIRNELTEESKKQVIKLLDTYGLKDFKDKYPNSLSGGMRQRVA